MNSQNKRQSRKSQKRKGYDQIQDQNPKVEANCDISTKQTHRTFLRSKKRSRERERGSLPERSERQIEKEEEGERELMAHMKS